MDEHVMVGNMRGSIFQIPFRWRVCEQTAMASVWSEYKRSEITAALTANDNTHVHYHRRAGKTRALLASPHIDLAQQAGGDRVRIVFVFPSRKSLTDAKAMWDERTFEETDADGNIRCVDLAVPEGTEVVFMTFDGYNQGSLDIDRASYLYIDEGCFEIGIDGMITKNTKEAKQCAVAFKVRNVSSGSAPCAGHASCLVR
jgi:hypothetical protein